MSSDTIDNDDAMPKPMPPIRAIEFFSGIGGLHSSLRRADPSASVVAAFDMNLVANACYQLNFGITPNTTGIDVLTTESISAMNANTWLLSPPCQPFTTGGLRRDAQDARSRGLLRLVQILADIRTPPTALFLENVPNFEVSECRELLIKTLADRGFVVREFLVSPLALGIPYDRRRYYLTAWRQHAVIESDNQGTIHVAASDTSHQPVTETSSISTLLPNITGNGTTPPIHPIPLSAYLDHNVVIADYLVDEAVIRKNRNYRYDLVNPTDIRCACFTKAYGSQHVKGSGSFLRTLRFDKPLVPNDLESVIASQPRFFTPTEIARLHGFNPIHDVLPSSSSSPLSLTHNYPRFKFPDKTTRIQQYRLLGNSLSVDVVAYLIRFMLMQLRLQNHSS